MARLTPWMLIAVLVVGAGPAAGQSGIQVVINGSPVALTPPAMMQAGQVMVPAIRVFEAFGAAAVWWPDDRVVLITNRTGFIVRLRIGETTALVNGHPRPLPAPPMMVGNQPFVPAQPLFALLGAWVRFDEPSRTLHVASQITALSVQRGDGAVRVVLEATGPLRAETRTLSNPDRLVVDLHGGALRLADQDHPVGEAGVVRIRAGQFQIKPYVTRVVFDVRQPMEWRTTTAVDGFRFTIEVRPQGPLVGQVPAPAPIPAPSPAAPVPPPAAPPPADAPPAVGVPPPPPGGPAPGGAAPPPGADAHASGVPVTPPPDAVPIPDDGVPRITQVRVEQAGSRFRVVIEGTMPLEYTVRELLEPDRVVVDVAGAIFLPVKQEIPVAGAVVAEVRAAQFQADPHIARVVVVLRRKAAYSVTPAEGGGTLIVEIPEPSMRAHVVAIDAGHGGRDVGAVGPTGLFEKDAVLDIAQRVRALLVQSGVRVVMTREIDTTVELADRPRIAKRQGATVFVSIHANASTRPGANGSETYYLSPQSMVLAQMVQEELGRVPGLANRGTKTANFLVLRESDVPSVLVEVAYVSNVEEEARLRQEAFRQRLAEAITRGVQRFLAVFPVPAN